VTDEIIKTLLKRTYHYLSFSEISNRNKFNDTSSGTHVCGNEIFIQVHMAAAPCCVLAVSVTRWCCVNINNASTLAPELVHLHD